MTGCSTKFAYNNFDWLVLWYFDDYIDFSNSQKAHFDQRLDDWIQWHRKEELAVFRTHLQPIRADIISSCRQTDSASPLQNLVYKAIGRVLRNYSHSLQHR